jgi:hypothetical protein
MDFGPKHGERRMEIDNRDSPFGGLDGAATSLAGRGSHQPGNLHFCMLRVS